MNERPEPEILTQFTFDSEPSFAIVRTDGEARESILSTISSTPIDLEQGPHETLKTAIACIDSAIAEGKVPTQKREELIQGARQAYFLIVAG